MRGDFKLLIFRNIPPMEEEIQTRRQVALQVNFT